MNIAIRISKTQDPDRPWHVLVFLNNISTLAPKYRSFSAARKFVTTFVDEMADDTDDTVIWLRPYDDSPSTITLQTEDDWALATLTYA